MGNVWEIVKEITTSPFGSLASVFAFLYLCGWLIYKITKVATEWAGKQAGIEKLEKKVDTISTDIQYIKATLEVMQTVAPDKRFTKSHSPVSLTKLGEEVAEKMKMKERIAANWERIYTLIDTSAIDKNAYDIQQLCIETATVFPSKLFGEKDLREMKEFAYNEGRPLAAYGSLIGVMIRDKYFEVKGISIGEVDQNDPNRKSDNP